MTTTTPIVDDHPSLRSMARKVLADAGYVVVGRYPTEIAPLIQTSPVRGLIATRRLSRSELEWVLS